MLLIAIVLTNLLTYFEIFSIESRVSLAQ